MNEWDEFPESPEAPAPHAVASAWDAFPRAPSYGAAESALEGALKGASANWRDEIYGASRASGLPEWLGGFRAPIGAARLAYEHYTKPAPTITDLVTGDKHKGWATKEYERARDMMRERESEMSRQNPYSFMGGDIAGTVGSALAMPLGPLARGAANLPRARTFEEGLRQAGQRIAGAAESGAIYGGIAGAGEGEGGEGTLTQAAIGAGTGTVFGAGAGVAGEALRPGIEKVGNLWHGYMNTDAEAAKRIAQAHLRGRALGAPLTPEETAAADAAGLPRVLADMSGQPGRALLRSAANTSPEAWQAASEFTGQRYAQRATRNATFIRNLTGGGDTAAELELLEQQAAAQNRRAYDLAMRTGRQNLWEDPEIQRLAQSPDIRRAILTAGRDEGNRAIMAGNQKPRLNPFVLDNGRLALRTSSTGKSTSAADISFWDGVKKRLQDWEGAARRSGRDAYARDLGILRRSLVQRLDAVVPEYQAARQGAAGFFGAEDALEAGHNFFRSNISNPRDLMEARQAFNRMGAAEQTLFRRAYASRLADTIEQSGNLNALEAAFRGPARQRTSMVLNPGATNQLEALLRAEYAVDKTRTALSGSTTVAQYMALGLAGGAADLALEKHFDPAHFFGAALAAAAAKHGVKLVDERVAKRVGEMLMSNDPGILNQGTLLASRNPPILNGLRQLTQKLSSIGGGAGAVAFHPWGNQRQQGFKHGGMITAGQDQRQHLAEGGDADDLSDWTPPSPTPGETYAAFGDTGAIRGETEGVSPAMRAMIRRNMGRRLYDQTMAEREQTAEHATRGAAGVAGFVNPFAGAATAGATSRFMGDTPTETAGQVAQSLLPYAGGRLLAAAPKTAAATYGAGAAMLPGSTQSASGETAAAIRQQRMLEEQKAENERANRKAAQKQKEMDAAAFTKWLADPGNSKAMEGIDPLIVSRIKGAPDLATAQDIFSKALGEKRDAQHLSEWKQENAGAIGGLADTWQKRIAGAGTYNEAKAIFDEGALARKEAAKTLAERYPEAMTLLEVAVPFASMALPAWSRNRQLNALERSAEKGEQLHTETFGKGAPELTQGALNEADAAARNIRAAQEPTSFNPLKRQSWQEHLGEIAGGTAVAYMGNTGIPGLVDMAMGSLSSDPGGAERAHKALENMTSKERWGVALGEGTLGTLGGNRLTDWRRSPVFARAESAARNLEKAPRNISPGSTLTEATTPGTAPGLPPAAPGPEPVPAAPPSQRSFPPSMFTNPPPVEQMPGYGMRADGTKIDMERLKGSPLAKHVKRIRRDAGFARGGRVDVRGLPMSTRRESNFSPTRGTPDHHCGPDAKWPHGFCEMYRKHNKCTAVAGFIATKGGCDWYKRAPHRAAGGRAEGGVADDDDPASLMDRARQQYPILSDQDISYKYSQGRAPFMLESWSPGMDESIPGVGRPSEFAPDKFGIEVYDPKTRPIDILGDVVSHRMINTDPNIKASYSSFAKSIEPWQEDILRGQYEHAKHSEEAETRPYAQWREMTGLPAYFRGYAFQQWPEEFTSKGYTPEQRKNLDQMMDYLRAKHARGGRAA